MNFNGKACTLKNVIEVLVGSSKIVEGRMLKNKEHRDFVESEIMGGKGDLGFFTVVINT